MVKPASSEHPSHPLGIFPELNTHCREINRHCSSKHHRLGCIVWIVVLLGCGGLFALQIRNLVRQYLRYNIQQTITQVGADSMSFPDLFICPLNALNLTKMTEEGFDFDLAPPYFMSVFERSLINLDKRHIMYMNVAYQRWLEMKTLTTNITNMEDALIYFSVDPMQQLKHCESGDKKTQCFPEGVKLKQSVSREGVCFLLKLKQKEDNGSWVSAKQHSPGYTGAKGVFIGSTGHDHLHQLHMLDNYAVYLGKLDSMDGYRGIMPLDAVYLQHHTVTLVNIVEKRVIRLDKPYSECFSEEDIKAYAKSKYSIILDHEYSLGMCHRECEAVYAMEKCNKTCVLPGQFSGKRHKYRICDIGEEFACISKQVRRAECFHCSNLCKYVTWSYSYNNVHTDLTEDAAIYLYYPEMHYITSDDSPSDPIANVLGEVGGQMSLWLGFKLATLAQIMYYVWVWGLAACCGNNSDSNGSLDEVHVGPATIG